MPKRMLRLTLTGTEMSFDEIAQELGICPSTARAIFQSGMRKLRCRTAMFRQLTIRR
jgi:DNA-binding CsgD family transcriptional regulator